MTQDELSLVFRSNEHGNAHAVETGGGSVWVGCCKSPSLLLNVSPSLDEVVPIRFDEGIGGLHDLAFDGQHLWVAHASGHLSRVDPATGAMESIRVKGSTGRPPFLYALHFDGQDLWAGTYTEPGRLFRIDRDTLACAETVLPVAPNHAVRALVATEEAVFVALYTVPGRVVVVDRQSGRQQTLELGDDNMLCTSAAFDGKRVWIGLDTRPATILCVDPATLDFDTVSFHTGSSCVRGLLFDGQSLWLGLYTEPGELIRFDPDTQDVERHVMPEELFNVRDLAADAGRVWAVTQNVRYQASGLYGLRISGRES